MLILTFHFTCYSQNSQVIFDPTSATATLQLHGTETQIQICPALSNLQALPFLQLGAISYSAPSIIFKNNESIFLQFACTEPSCDASCQQPFDAAACRDCKAARIVACRDDTADVAQVSFIFPSQDLEMTFAAGKFFTAACELSRCFGGFSLVFSPDLLQFQTIPNMCQFEHTDAATAAIAAGTCSEPVDFIPVDCPWIQIAVNGQILNVMAYISEDLMEMNQFNVSCSEVPAEELESCKSMLDQINQLGTNEITVQLAVSVARNFGWETVEMPENSMFLIKGEVVTQKPSDAVDCYENVQINAFQNEIWAIFTPNPTSSNCPELDFEVLIVTISGETDQQYEIQNEFTPLQIQEILKISCKNAPNSTECAGNYSILLNNHREKQSVKFKYMKENAVVDERIFVVSVVQEAIRDVTVIFYDISVCVQAVPLKWVQIERKEVNFEILVENVQISWRQQIPQDSGQYCTDISQQESSQLAILSLKNQGSVEINQELIPILSFSNGRKQDFHYKQIVVLLLGVIGFPALIIIIYIARSCKK